MDSQLEGFLNSLAEAERAGGRVLHELTEQAKSLELREMLKATAGQEIELTPEHYEPVSDRDVLLRLQNNLKSRLLQAGRQEQAARVVDTMLMLAPELAELWHESGILHARLGNMRASVNALEEFVRRAPEGMERHQAAAFLQQLKSKLN